jgi:hypothetical protein
MFSLLINSCISLLGLISRFGPKGHEGLQGLQIRPQFQTFAAWLWAETISSKGVHKIALAWNSMCIAAFFTIQRAEARGAIFSDPCGSI